MTVENILEACVFDVRVVTDEDGKTVYTPFSGEWDPEWDSKEVRWLDATEEGVIVIGI